MANAQAISTGNVKSGRSNQPETKVWRPFFAFILFTVIVTLAGYTVFQRYQENLKIDMQNELGGIASLKTRQIIDWMEHRKGDAQATRNDPFFLSEVGRWLQQGGPAGETKSKLTERLTSLQQSEAAYGYTSISLFDDHALLRLSSSADEAPIQGMDKKRLLESMRSGQVLFSDIQREKLNSGEQVEIELSAPLTLVKNGKAHTIGVVLFRIDPSRFLFPLIQRWPTPSPSAENILVRRDGDDVLFMNELRHRKNTALTMRIPLSQQQLPAAMVAKGQEGLVEGVDYRGMPVVAVLSKVAGTSWFMVSKIDKAEIYAPINQFAKWMAALMLAVVGVGGGIAIFWRQKEIRQYESEIERLALAEHFGYLSKYANDIILLFDDTGKIVDFNDRALEVYGYTAAELSGINVNLLRAIEFTPLFAEKLKEIDLAGALRFESTHIRKNRVVFPVEASVRRIDIGGAKFYQSIIRDITERKQAETELARQKMFMWQVIDTDPNLIYVKDADGKFLMVNQALANLYGMAMHDMIGETDEEINPGRKGLSGYLKPDTEAFKNGQEVILAESSPMANDKQNWYLTIKKPLPQADGSINVLGIAVDITGQKLLEMKLTESYKELQRLTSHLENVKEDERTRIARELHDEMGAMLAALKMRVAWLISKLPPELTLLSEETGHISDLVSDGINTVRNIVRQLRPTLLEDVGLDAAIEDYVRQFRQNTNIECILVLPEEGLTLETDQSSAIFRILQESLNNIAKHAQASEVNILFTRCSNSLSMVVEDDGLGFVQTHKEKSFGLLGIRERALIAGGKAKISSTHGKGTRVSVTVPAPYSKQNAQEYADNL